jgi:phosphoribosylformylglycinamidine synthase
VGVRVGLDELLDRDGIDLFTALFSESAGRAVVSVPREEEVRFTDMCTARGLAHLRIGVTDTGDDGQASLDVQGRFSVPVAELRAAHTATLPRHFG